MPEQAIAIFSIAVLTHMSKKHRFTYIFFVRFQLGGKDGEHDDESQTDGKQNEAGYSVGHQFVKRPSEESNERMMALGVCGVCLTLISAFRAASDWARFLLVVSYRHCSYDTSLQVYR